MRRRRDERHARARPAKPRDLLRHLVGGDLPSLAGLRPLRDLDLELLGKRRVLGRDAEAAGSHLLDLRVALVAIPRWILSALARVRASAEPVERHGDRLVRLRGERAVRHRAAREAADDRVDPLDLIERKRLGDRDELEEVARLERGSPVDELGEPVVEVLALALHRLHQRVRGGDARLQRVDDVGVGRMRLSALAELVEARVLDLRLLGHRGGQPPQRVALEPVEPDPADRRGGAAEEPPAEAPVEAHGLEQARASVARDVRDPHLRHHLQDAVLERAQEPRLRLGRRGPVAADLVGLGQPGDRLEREPRADDVCAVADERRDHVGVPGLVRRHEERAGGAQAALDEAAVGGGDGEQRRDGSSFASRCRVGEAEGGRAAFCELHARVGDALDRGTEALAGGEGRVDLGRLERREPGRRDEERRQHHELRQHPLGVERCPRADQRRDRHDCPLAVVVDRRVRHLGEPLPEVRGQRAARPASGAIGASSPIE